MDAFEVMLVELVRYPHPSLWAVRVYKNEERASEFKCENESSARTYLGGVVQGLKLAGHDPAISEGEEREDGSV